MDLQQKYVDLYQELYADLVEAGIDPEKAQAMAHDRVSLTKDLISDVLDDLWYSDITVRRVFPVNVIEGWDLMMGVEQEAVLNDLGFDMSAPWRLREGEYSVAGKPRTGRYIEGSERVDDNWIASGHASWEATLEQAERLHGKQHRRELESKMCGR